MLEQLLGCLLVLAPTLALWDYGRRRLDSHNARGDKLLTQAAELKETAQQVASRGAWFEQKLEDSHEYTRLVLSNFINSATDIITISEEEKRHLRNKLAVAPKPKP
jgi:hypothetical protein